MRPRLKLIEGTAHAAPYGEAIDPYEVHELGEVTVYLPSGYYDRASIRSQYDASATARALALELERLRGWVRDKLDAVPPRWSADNAELSAKEVPNPTWHGWRLDA